MKPEHFIRDYGVEKAREVVEGAPSSATTARPSLDFKHYLYGRCENAGGSHILLSDLKRLVESLDRFNKFEDKQEALDAIDDAPEGATDYRKLSCGTRYIKQGPRFFEYWNGSEWCRPTVPFTVETHILRFDKLEDLKQSIKDHESIYGGGDE